MFGGAGWRRRRTTGRGRGGAPSSLFAGGGGECAFQSSAAAAGGLGGRRRRAVRWSTRFGAPTAGVRIWAGCGRAIMDAGDCVVIETPGGGRLRISGMNEVLLGIVAVFACGFSAVLWWHGRGQGRRWGGGERRAARREERSLGEQAAESGGNGRSIRSGGRGASRRFSSCGRRRRRHGRSALPRAPVCRPPRRRGRILAGGWRKGEAQCEKQSRESPSWRLRWRTPVPGGNMRRR